MAAASGRCRSPNRHSVYADGIKGAKARSHSHYGQFTVLLLITFAVACILSEAYRAITKYDNRFIHMAISFVLFCYGMLGSPLAIWVYKDSFLTQIQLNGMSAEYVESLSGLISTPMLIALCVSPIIGGTIGALIAKGLFSKHFRKAGIV